LDVVGLSVFDLLGFMVVVLVVLDVDEVGDCDGLDELD